MKRTYLAALAAPLALASDSAFADVNAAVGTALAAVSADAVTLAGLVTPIVITVLGLVIGIKLIKRFGSKI